MTEFLNLGLVNSLEVLIEEGSFSRAAARLFITPPAMTQQIQRLEAAVGYRLVERGSKPVRLTRRGSGFMVHASAALAQARLALGVDADRQTLRIGFINGYPGGTDEGFLIRFRAENPTVDVTFVQVSWGEQIGRLLDGDLDASLARPPYDDATGIDTVPVHREKRVVAVPIDSPLAEHDSLTLADLDGHPVVGAQGISREWTKYWVVDPRPSGEPVEYGVWAATMEEAINGVALGGNIMVTADSVAKRYQHTGLTYLDLTDGSTCQVDLCTRSTDKRPAIRALRRAARAEPPARR
ncbi:LysR family transcriptional regulator [Gordonia insulae]|uniref:HTH-type transcriptional regulator CatM n=1 Tax=Gordonia insulae TaxID=2420509 RepID=A0A3G8JIV4_9ACTN|nr:LysR family transcriptional regulator [Gordonia insulae]AZG44150.1 HTH-type transcriptional regulator CatM [Gordonia insulae]